MSVGSRRYGYASQRHYVRMAALGGLLILVATVVVFTKPSTIGDRYEVDGIFASANQLRKNSVVRLGGLDVGKVTAIEAGPAGTALVSLQITDDDVVLRDDARLAIKPRLVLEGNAYVDLSLGSPGLPALDDGATIPLERTTVPVQLDQAFGAFDAPSRSALQDVTREFATGLGGEPSGARALRQSVREWDRSLESIEATAAAAQGTQPTDLSMALSNAGAVTEQFATDRRALAGIVTSYARVSGALAARDEALGTSMRELARLLAAAPADLRTIDGALPPLSRFARNLQPAIRIAPPALRAADGVLDQIDRLVRERELGRMLRALQPVTSTLPLVERQLTQLTPSLTDTMRCLDRTTIPALKQVVPDGIHTTGDPVWLDALHAGASLAAASPNFDGNGTTIRLGVTESEQAIQGILPSIGMLEGAGEIRGMNPSWMGYGTELVARPDQPCDEQDLPDYAARATNGPDWLTPVRRARPPADEAGPLARSLRRMLGLQPFANQRVDRPDAARPARPGAPAQTAPAPVATATTAPSQPAAPKPGKDPVRDVVKPLLDQVVSTALPDGKVPVVGKTLDEVLDGILGPLKVGGG